MLRTIIITLALCIVLYLLYINGYAVTQSKRAIMYVESKKGTRASFTSCTGFTRRVVRFGESKTCRFVFTPELTAGKMSAELLDSAKNTILCLNESSLSAQANVDKSSRYYLVFRFKSASGKYALDWE